MFESDRDFLTDPREASSFFPAFRLISLKWRRTAEKPPGTPTLRGGTAVQTAPDGAAVASLGAQVIRARIQAVQELERYAVRYHSDLTHGQEVLRLFYRPAYDPYPVPPGQLALPLDAPVDRSALSLEAIQQGFLDCLGRLRSEEIARGQTTIGPHRDELRLLANGIDLGTFGSRGQGRTAVLALKLAEMSWMKEKSGEWPVLLLDEVLAELDPSRRSDLLSHLLEGEQAMLTTPDLDLFTAEFVEKALIWRIQGGRVQL